MTAPADGARRPVHGATLEQVAAIAGVSRSTVSRVINDSPKVSERVRAAVLAAIEQLGYVPNRAARSLVTRRSGSVALVVTEPEQRVFAEPFFAGIVRGVSRAVADTDLQLVLMMAATDRARARLEGYLGSGHVDGVLLLSLHGHDPMPEHLVASGLPVVTGGRPSTDLSVSYVDADNAGGARAATAHLLAGGRTRVATITGPPDMSVSADRRTGYRAALAAADVAHDPGLEEAADFTQVGGAEATRRLLARRPDLDAVFAASDLMAAGALHTLHAAGRRVPDDVAVVGFDDSIIATSSQPSLTTVRQPVEVMGREMVRLLVRHLDGGLEAAQQLVLGTELVVRDSA